MSKFFEVVGYVASVLAAAFGIVYLINKLSEREIDEEIEDELCGDADDAADAADAPADAAEVVEDAE